MDTTTRIRRLTQLADALWPKCVEGNLHAIEIYSKILERRAQLTGGKRRGH